MNLTDRYGRPHLTRTYDRKFWELSVADAAMPEDRTWVLRVANDGTGEPAFTFGFYEMGDWNACMTKAEYDDHVEAIVQNDPDAHVECPLHKDAPEPITREEWDVQNACVICLELTRRAAESVMYNLYRRPATTWELELRAHLIRVWSGLSLIVDPALP